MLLGSVNDVKLSLKWRVLFQYFIFFANLIKTKSFRQTASCVFERTMRRVVKSKESPGQKIKILFNFISGSKQISLSVFVYIYNCTINTNTCMLEISMRAIWFSLFYFIFLFFVRIARMFSNVYFHIERVSWKSFSRTNQVMREASMCECSPEICT